MHSLSRSLPHGDGAAPQPQSCNICGSGNLCTVDCCRYCGSLCDTVPRSKNHAVLRQLVERYGRHAASLGVGAEGAAVSQAARGARAEELLATLLDRLELMLLGSAAGEGEGDRDNALRWSEELGLIGKAPERRGQLHHRSQPPAFLQTTGGAGDGGSSSSGGGGGAPDASAGYERPRFFYWQGRDASEGVGLAGADPKGLRTLLVALLLAPLGEAQQDRALTELRLNARTRLLVRGAAARLGGMEAKRHWATVQDALARLGKNDVGALLLDLTGALVAAGKAAPTAPTTAAPVRAGLAAASPKVAAPSTPVVSEQPVQQVEVPTGVDTACSTRSETDELQRAAVAEGASRLAGGGAKGASGARAVLALLDRAVLNSVGVPLEAGNDDESRIAAHARTAAREAAADVAATLSSPEAGGGGVMGHCASLAFLLRRLQADDDPENVLPVPELQMPPPGLMGGCLVAAEDPAEACARTLLHGVTDETRDALLHAWFHGQELQAWIAENAPELITKARSQVVLVRAKKTEEEVAEEEARKLELLEKQAAAAGKVLRNRKSLAARLTAFAVGSDAGGDDAHRESTVPPAFRPRRMSTNRPSAPDPAAIAIARRASSMRRKPQMHDASCQTTGETEGAGEWGDALPELKRGNATATLMERLDRTRRKTMRGDSPKKKTRSKKKSQDLDSKVADFDWTIKQVLALFEKRAEAEAAIKASTRRGAGASAGQGMADFVYDDFIRQFGIPALARRKMQELLEALDVHASTDNPIVACFLEVLNDSAPAQPDGEEVGGGGDDDSAAPREADLLANFVTDAILAVRSEVATNVVFPPEAGETRINWIAESRSRKLLPVLFHGRWGLEGADKAAVVAAIKVQRTRGAGRWRLERHAGYQLAKTWRLSLLHFVQVVVTDFKRQLRARPVSRGTMIRESQDAMTRAVSVVAEGVEGEEEDDDDYDDDDEGGDEGTPGRGVNENELLISNSIFSSANAECRALILERCSLVHFDPGHVIMRKGDPADEMFIVKHGEVEVRVAVGGSGGVEKVVGTLSAPDFFGESALMEKGGRRTATISVPAAKRVTFSGGDLGAAGGGGGGGGGPPARRSGVDLLKLTRADFDKIMDANPAFQEELRARNAGYIVIERVPMFQGRGRAFTYVCGSLLAHCFRARSLARFRASSMPCVRACVRVCVHACCLAAPPAARPPRPRHAAQSMCSKLAAWGNTGAHPRGFPSNRVRVGASPQPQPRFQ